MAQRWLSIVEYARAFNISDMTIRRRIKTGKLSATLKDGKYFIPVSEESYARSQDSASKAALHKEPYYSNAALQGASNNASAENAQSIQRGNAAVVYAEKHSVVAKPWQSNHSSVMPPPPPTASLSEKHASTYNYLPSHISAAASGQTSGQASRQMSVDSKELFDICEEFMSRLAKQAEDLKESYGNKVLCLEKTLELKEAKICELSQKIEDLQLLVEIFEGKKTTSMQ